MGLKVALGESRGGAVLSRKLSYISSTKGGISFSCSGLDGPLLKIVRVMSDANLRGLRYPAVLDRASGLRTPRRHTAKSQKLRDFQR